MAEFVMDPKLGQEAAEALSNFFNGEMTAGVMDAFDAVKNLGEDNPQVEGAKALVKGYEEIFNDQCLPVFNKVRDNMLKNAEFAAKFNAVQVAKVSGPADMGQVQEANYDAASQL